MRWNTLQLNAGEPGTESGPSDQPAAPALFERGAISRTFDTPGFRGITFFEIHARSIINKVPESSRMAFRWTINPYRGCSHACTYCFARSTHKYLDLDAGHDFDSKIVVKVNAPELARKELAAAKWRGEHVAMGTNVDCYQRAEGRYRLMPGILAALRDAANPFSILTKGTLILRDLALLEEAAEVTDVGLNVSVGSVDKELWRSIEPGTPAPERRLQVCRTFTEHGLRCGVLMGPVVPFLSDSPRQLEETVRQIAAAGAIHVTPIVLHLRPGAREWFFQWLEGHHPDLVPRYRALYRSGAYVPHAYQERIAAQVAGFARKHGVGRVSPGQARAVRTPRAPRPAARLASRALARATPSPGDVQLSLL